MSQKTNQAGKKSHQVSPESVLCHPVTTRSSLKLPSLLNDDIRFHSFKSTDWLVPCLLTHQLPFQGSLGMPPNQPARAGSTSSPVDGGYVP